ncbi:B12-binding domain-containing radical SAM protein [Candidatus Bathyarchaeota archaeon]|nr:B12-binding domain-containing radical SAM protein [Candidatus Bathyarchaeota archaeon]
MKFSFINARPNDSGYATMTYASPPLGILYVTAFLEKAGIEVSALDQTSKNHSVESVVDWVMKENPDILGISTLLSSSLIAPKIAEKVKERNPNVTIVFGNHHATCNSERILRKYPSVDIVVRGEGEQTCLQLVDSLKAQGSLKDVPGISFRHKDEIISNPDRPLIKDVDSLPFPHRDLLDVEYHNTTIGIVVAPKKFTTILSSRGCVFRCCFCSCTSMAHNLWRPRSVKNILEEIHFLTSQGYRQLMFVDDNFTLDQNRVIELCQRIRKEKIDIEWICEGRVDQCSYTMFKEMVKAGCRMLYFGIESANQKVLDYYGKGITPNQSQQATKLARRAGVDVIVGSFIIGAPNETRKDIQRTLDFTQQLDLDIPQINLLQANPGTLIWEEYKNKGLLDETKYWETGVLLSDICHNAVPAHELLQMVNKYYKNYLLCSQYILKQILLTVKSSYRRNIVINNLSRVKTIRNSLNNLTSEK